MIIVRPTILAKRFTSSIRWHGIENCSGLLHRRVKFRKTYKQSSNYIFYNYIFAWGEKKNICWKGEWNSEKSENNRQIILSIKCSPFCPPLIIASGHGDGQTMKVVNKTPRGTWAFLRGGCRMSQGHCLFSPKFIIWLIAFDCAK